MSKWSTIPLAELAEVFNGKTPSKSEQRSHGHPVLKIKDVSDLGEFRGTFDSFVDLDLADAYAGKRLRVGDTLILNAAHNADYVGSKTYRVQPPVAGALATGEWLVIRPAESRLDPGFVFHWVNSTGARRVIRDMVKGIHLYPKDVARLRIPLPPLPEQRRIAEILDKADALRAKRRAALAKLDTLTQSIFLDMFGDPATNPKGWPRKQISGVATVITGNTPPRAMPQYYGHAIEWMKSDNINTPHYYLTRADEGLSELGRRVARVVPAGSILVTCIAGSPDCIGNSAMTDREVAFNQQINAVVPFDGNGHFIYGLLRVGKRLVQQALTTAMKGMVSKSRFERIALIWPPIPLQESFAQRVCAVEEAMRQQTVSLDSLDGLLASLQHRAFRGEL